MNRMGLNHNNTRKAFSDGNQIESLCAFALSELRAQHSAHNDSLSPSLLLKVLWIRRQMGWAYSWIRW